MKLVDCKANEDRHRRGITGALVLEGRVVRHIYLENCFRVGVD